MVDVVERFALEAMRLEWVLSGTNSGRASAREVLVLVTRLYLAALALPQPGSEGLESGSSAGPPGQKCWDDLHPTLAARLPFQHYGEVFNPLPLPPEPPVVGDLADDIADVFLDVDRGLRLYDAGRRGEAVWQWSFSLASHWGEHATSAIRALHCHMAAECMDRLTNFTDSSPPQPPREP